MQLRDMARVMPSGVVVSALCAVSCLAFVDPIPFDLHAIDVTAALSRTSDGWIMRAPDPSTAHFGSPLRAPRSGAGMYALAFHYDARLFDRPEPKARVIGSVRRGTVLRGARAIAGKTCRRGAWYEIPGFGFACSGDGFVFSAEPKALWFRQPAPQLNRALPFNYARVITQGALRFHRLPTKSELAEIAAKTQKRDSRALPEVVQGQLRGDYFVALDRVEAASGRRFYRTVRGRYLHAEDVKARPAPRMQGVLLSGTRALPYAFVYGDTEAPLLELEGRARRVVGRAEVHARFPVRAKGPPASSDLVPAAHGLYVPRDRVRIARKKPRPAGVPPRSKWIHVDLDEQTLVAYENDEPVFATLVSTGKEATGHATPAGLFRIREKHVSVTMSGRDPIDGRYEVAEVPWTQFYHEAYALHGAYWHDTFGATRSHGCTNIAPADARWLFRWTTPQLLWGLHARRGFTGGTHVLLTRAVTASLR